MTIDARSVHATLARHQLADGFEMVLDLEKSHGVWLHDARTGHEYLDAFTCFASWPIGYNHPMMIDAQTNAEILAAGRNNPSNSDLYTREMARFVETFATQATPAGFPYHFWVAGGALAVENALKTAFDWKARKLGRTSFADDVNDLVILHFQKAFHGRSGYTLSLTNTLPDKIGLFPKFPWPRVSAPAMEFDADGRVANDVESAEKRTIAEIKDVCAKHRRKVAGIIIETMQGEGGDRHFRPEFFRELRRICDEEEALLILDEVQTGFFGSGSPWLWEQKGIKPDVVAFGKKTQVCGIYAGPRLDEVENHVFRMPSRINSTWGGNLVDMVRCRRFIEIIKAQRLEENVRVLGQQVLKGMRSIARETGAFSNVRGVGSLIAFTFPTPDARRAMLERLYDAKVMALNSGEASIRFRLPLVMTTAEADVLLERVESCCGSAVRG